jgi:hypothetical protein
VVDCTTAQHWKGNDVVLHFATANPMLLRLFKGFNDLTSQEEFFNEVPRRFAKPPVVLARQ